MGTHGGGSGTSQGMINKDMSLEKYAGIKTDLTPPLIGKQVPGTSHPMTKI
jgi:hypothetical protein